jgi:hypothetical protein
MRDILPLDTARALYGLRILLGKAKHAFGLAEAARNTRIVNLSRVAIDEFGISI